MEIIPSEELSEGDIIGYALIIPDDYEADGRKFSPKSRSRKGWACQVLPCLVTWIAETRDRVKIHQIGSLYGNRFTHDRLADRCMQHMLALQSPSHIAFLPVLNVQCEAKNLSQCFVDASRSLSLRIPLLYSAGKHIHTAKTCERQCPKIERRYLDVLKACDRTWYHPFHPDGHRSFSDFRNSVVALFGETEDSMAPITNRKSSRTLSSSSSESSLSSDNEPPTSKKICVSPTPQEADMASAAEGAAFTGAMEQRVEYEEVGMMEVAHAIFFRWDPRLRAPDVSELQTISEDYFVVRCMFGDCSSNIDEDSFA